MADNIMYSDATNAYIAEQNRAAEERQLFYDRILAPLKAAYGATREVKARGEDWLSNQAASLLGAEPTEPNERLMAAQANAEPAYRGMSDIVGGAKALGSSIGESTVDALRNARNTIVSGMGWKDLPAQSVATTPSAPPPVQAGPRTELPTGKRTGALPTRTPRAPRPPTSIGALPDFTTDDERAAPPIPGEAPAGPTAPNVAAPTTPQKGSREQYMERLAGMAKQPTPGMTEEQKGQALMEAGLAIMAAGSRPGASVLGSIGQGGLAGTAAAREMQRINRERADKARSEARADVRTEFDLAGKDADRADRKEDKTEVRKIHRLDVEGRAADRKERNKNEATRINLLRQQIEAAGWQLKDGADGKVHAYNVRTNEDRITPLKAKPDHSGRNQQIEFLEYVLKTPGAKEVYLKQDSTGMSQKDVIKEANKILGEQVKGGSTESPEVLLQRNADAIRRVAGIPVAPAPLPPGIPPGSKPIGTKNGNPVYQTPDGRKLVVTK